MRGLLSALVMMVASVVSAVTLDPLVPGKGYKELTVSGSSAAAVEVTLTDRTDVGVAPVVQAAEVTEGRFSTKFTGLVPGHEYAVTVDGKELETVVMAREVTDGWLYEDCLTYLGLTTGTGVWSGDGESSVMDGRIIISAEVASDYQYRVEYLPTNRFGSVSGYRVFANICFDGEASTPRTTDGIFGLTLVTDPLDSSRAIFYILDEQNWKSSGVVGQSGTNYDVEYLVDEVNRRVGYYLVGDSGRTYLGYGRIPEGSPTRFRSVDFQGFGSVAVLEGEACDTKVVSAEVHLDGDFSNGVFRAGMNFTNLVLNGWVAITNLWEADSFGGYIEVRIVGSDGVARLTVTNEWDGFGGIYGITNLVDSLVQGDNYTIEVNVLDENGSGELIKDDGHWSSRGIMGRVRDAWYDEDAATVSGEIEPTGIWKVDSGISITADDNGFVVVATDGTAEDPCATFTPTNVVPRNGLRTINSFEVVFSSAFDTALLPDASAELFGISLVDDEGQQKLAVVINGAWAMVERSVFAPEVGRTYTIDAVCGQTESGSQIEYYVTDEGGVMQLVARGSFRAGAKPYPAEIKFRGDGRFASAIGEFFDTTLFEIDFDMTSGPGTNFTAVAVSSESGIIRVTPLWETDCSNGTVRVVVRNGRGETVALKDVEFHGDTPVDIHVDGLEPGDSYTVSAYVIETDGPVDGDVEMEDYVTPTAKRYDGKWIYEDWATFSGKEAGTGDWTFRKSPIPEAKVLDDPSLGAVIQIESDLSSSINFESTDVSQTVINSTIREITFEVCSEAPGYVLSAPEFPKVRPADLAGVTIACDDYDGDKLYFSVYNPGGAGSWHVLSNTVAELNRVYAFTVLISYPNPNKTASSSITYYRELSDGRREQIAFFEPGKKLNGTEAIPEITDAYRTRVRFVGSGLVKCFEGECYDAHLAAISGVEYWTIEEAIHEIGTSGRILTPLWLSTYVADMNEGWFGVNDPNHWLHIIWPLGYVVEITDRGEIRFYLFHLSDYWIDWAIAEDAIPNGDGWEVKTANGLAWLARESTNHWVNGTVTLTADITNLYEHIWTPIRGFTGTFDGGGRKLVGLTNKGEELCATNELGISAYGLFAAASNSVFRNVAFDKVSVSNSADAVAALLGCSIGDVALTNIVIRSGSLTGGGTFVSGIVGYMGDFSDVSVFQNFNAADIATINAPLGGVNAAGIANLGLDGGAPARVTIAENENRGSISSVINSTIGGGNVAQIVAGSEPSARFDPAATVVTDNVGTGDVSRVVSLNHDGCALRKLPVVNLAGEVSRQSADSAYKEFIEANDSTDIVIDPWRLTARMTSGFYQNYETNFAGRINDQITAALPGQTVTLQEPCQISTPIELDRAITLELANQVIDNVFIDYTFRVSDDAGGAVVQNGTVTHPVNKLANKDPGDQWYLNNVNTFSWSTNYWDRGIFINGEFVDNLLAMSMMLAPGSIVSPIEDSGFAVNAKKGTIEYNGRTAFSLAPAGYKLTDNGDGCYTIEIDEEELTEPVINLSLSPNGGTSRIVIKKTKANYSYTLKSGTTLEGLKNSTAIPLAPVAHDGDDLVFEVDTSATSCFYQIGYQKETTE